MNTRTLILIVILGVITIGLVVLAIQSQSQPQPAVTTPSDQPAITEKEVNPTSVLYFEKAVDGTVSTGSSSATTTTPLNIMLNSYQNQIMGAQIEISYDPQVLSNVKITTPATSPNSFFGEASSFIVLDNTVKQNEGRISYVIAMSPSSEAKKGIGTIGTLTFSKKGTLPTTISFLEKSNVQELGTVTSVLKEAQSITIE